jgi:RNA recognition motif-containing protein
VRTLFQPFGDILDLFISHEKGFAFVKYNSKEDALSAINALNGTTLPGGVRPLEVRIAQSTKGMDDDGQSVTATGVVSGMGPPRKRGKWTEYFSPEGKAYYYDNEARLTTWDVPDIFKSEDSEIPPPPPPSSAQVGVSRVPTPAGVDKGPAGSNVFVYGLPSEWNERDFSNEFSKYGRIISTKIVYDKVSGTSKGYGFISYTNTSSAESAVAAMHGASIGNGKKLKVQIKRGEEGRSTRPY